MTAAGAQVLRLLILAIAATFRPKSLLIAENLCLRQQLVVLQRRHPRPCLRNADRRFWILASRWFSDWRNPLLIVKPETVLGFDPISLSASPFCQGDRAEIGRSRMPIAVRRRVKASP
jgi:hypothetical protein